MRTVTITEATNGLARLLERVQAGESITIVDRGLPIARLEPIGTQPAQTGRLRPLERGGLVRVGAAPPPLDLLREPGPPLPDGVSAVEALIGERRASR